MYIYVGWGDGQDDEFYIPIHCALPTLYRTKRWPHSPNPFGLYGNMKLYGNTHRTPNLAIRPSASCQVILEQLHSQAGGRLLTSCSTPARKRAWHAIILAQVLALQSSFFAYIYIYISLKQLLSYVGGRLPSTAAAHLHAS
eukprot:1157909-Pelagomonas_calceolata.AAC.11